MPSTDLLTPVLKTAVATNLKTYGLNRSGRKAGSLNRKTLDVRLALAKLVQGNVGSIQRWLDAIESGDAHTREGARDAFRCFLGLLEYQVPKLSRAIVTGEDGPVEIQVSWAGQVRETIIEVTPTTSCDVPNSDYVATSESELNIIESTSGK